MQGRKESTVRYIINSQVVLSRAPDGPLAAHIGPFAKSQSVQGYARHSIHQQVRLAAGFSHWLQQQRVALRHVSSDHLSRYLRGRARRVRPCSSDAATLRHLLDFLRREGVIGTEKIAARRLTPAERCVQEYVQYLRDARALARTTIINYVPFIRGFLTDRFGTGPVKLACLKAVDVVRFVQRQAPRLHLKRAKLLTTALRSFLRYARYRGEVALDLAAAVPIVANWSMPSIPRAIGTDQVCQLLRSIDRRNAIGRRDYAILLLLARLGLRSGEVAFLELEDIDWDAGQLSVRGKRDQRTTLPLSYVTSECSAGVKQHDGLRADFPPRREFLLHESASICPGGYRAIAQRCACAFSHRPMRPAHTTCRRLVESSKACCCLCPLWPRLVGPEM